MFIGDDRDCHRYNNADHTKLVWIGLCDRNSACICVAKCMDTPGGNRGSEIGKVTPAKMNVFLRSADFSLRTSYEIILQDIELKGDLPYTGID